MNTFCVVVFVHIGLTEAVILSGEAKLLVVNIVTSPIRTDCGWTAPVVGFCTQAEGFLIKSKNLLLGTACSALHC